MKIGQFAAKHNMTPSTIRYYIDLGLLFPQKNGSQYTFTSNDDSELKLIKELKELGYSLKEMQKYISTVRLYEQQDASLDKRILQLLKEKELSLASKKAEIDLYLSRVHDKIQHIQHTGAAEEITEAAAAGSSAAVPLTFIPLLKCPQCGSPLKLERATIVSGGVTDANLECGCGYGAEIKDGILFCGKLYDHEQDPDFIRCFFGNYKQIESYDDIFFESSAFNSPELMLLQHKAFRYIQEKIRSMDPRRGDTIMVPDISCHLLYKLHNEPYLKNASIIVPTFTPSCIFPMQKRLKDLGLNILYIVNQDSRLPLPAKLADTIIDYDGINNFSFFNKKSFLETFSPFFSDDALLISYSEYYDSHAATLGTIRDTYKFSMEHVMTWKAISSACGKCGFTISEKEEIGICKDPGKFWEYHNPGDKRHCVCLTACRANKGD